MSTPLPTKPKKEAVTVQIDLDLLTKAREHIERRGDKLRGAVEYGLRRYVEACEAENQLPLKFGE